MTTVEDRATSEAMHLNLNRELYSDVACHFIGTLSPKSKHLLTLTEEQRIGDAFSDLLAEMENIEFFKSFSNRAKESLAKSLKFVTYPADEVLLRQGVTDQPPQALYVLLSGVVTEHYKPPMASSDTPTLWPEKILRKGEFFGHVDIVHGRPPSVDAQTVGYCELLTLARDDFEIVRKEMETRCAAANHYLRTSQAIGRFDWSDEEYRVLEIYSKICTFADNQDIYSGAVDNKPVWSYFVVAGAGKLARGLACVKAVPTEEAKGAKVATGRLEFEEVRQGYYFGVGESFDGNHVIASSTLECLLIPRLLLVFKNRELLHAMAKDLTDSLPSDQEVLDGQSKVLAASSKRKGKGLSG